jgi:hypothetical protein
VRHEVGPIAIPAKIEFVPTPAQDAQRQDHAPAAQGAGLGQPMGDTSTLEG